MKFGRSVGAIAAVVLAVALPASAGYVEIGGGWAAEWDDGLDPFVNIESLEVTEDAVFIRKSAEFTQGQQEGGGGFPTIPIVFRQIGWPAVSNIVIEDEIITNSTGESWTGFRMQILDGGNARFDPEATMNSGGPDPLGWRIDPFTTGVYEDNDERLVLGGGLVADGETWLPGSGEDGGQLWISVVPQTEDPFTLFVLKETPLPAPGALAMLLLGAAVRRRRRR